jgi:4-amino-4-deoxy-L-arabinose transferase-like glycosyltransferase
MPADLRLERILPTSRRGWWIVALVLVAALGFRIGVVLAIKGGYHPETDALQFDQLATRLARGYGFGPAPQAPMIGPTALRAPLYPLVLAGTYALFGIHSFTSGLVVNALLGVVIVALVGVVGTQLCGRRIGGTAMGLAAVFPPMVLTGSSLQLEPLLTTLCLGALAAALQHRRRPRGILWPVVAGVCIGLGVLAREQAFFFLPVIAWLLWTADGRRPAWRARATRIALVAPVCAVLVVLPWTIRNAVELHAFVPVTTSAGFGLAGTYNDTAEAQRARWIPPYNDPRAQEVILELHNPTEVRMDAALRHLSLQIMRETPSYPFSVALWNTIRGFDLDGGAYTRLIAPFVPYPSWLLNPSIWAGWLLLALAILGATTAAIRQAPRSVWLIPIALTAFMAVALPFSIRYRALLEPFTLVLAAGALVAIVDAARASSSPPAPSSAPPPPIVPGRRRQLVAAPDPDVRPSRPR